MICLRCGHYIAPDGEMERAQGSAGCPCPCHASNHCTAPAGDELVRAIHADLGTLRARLLRAASGDAIETHARQFIGGASDRPKAERSAAASRSAAAVAWEIFQAAGAGLGTGFETLAAERTLFDAVARSGEMLALLKVGHDRGDPAPVVFATYAAAVVLRVAVFVLGRLFDEQTGPDGPSETEGLTDG